MAPSEQTKEYVLKTGSHTWIDGKTYVAGDENNNKMQLTREQMERIGKERFEGQTVEAANTEDVDRLKEENRQLREQLAQFRQGINTEENSESGSEDYSEFVNRSVADIATSLQSITDLSALTAIQAEESKGGNPRVGVLKAINQRREELGNA